MMAGFFMIMAFVMMLLELKVPFLVFMILALVVIFVKDEGMIFPFKRRK